MLNNIVT